MHDKALELQQLVCALRRDAAVAELVQRAGARLGGDLRKVTAVAGMRQAALEDVGVDERVRVRERGELATRRRHVDEGEVGEEGSDAKNESIVWIAALTPSLQSSLA
jgi:hypothetical protein